jgi:hypothetical protein
MFKTMTEFKKAHKAQGGHFFDAQAMRFFNSKIESNLLGLNGVQIFITSERFTTEHAKKYTIRHAMPSGEVGMDLSEFQQFETLEQAIFTAGKIINEYENLLEKVTA